MLPYITGRTDTRMMSTVPYTPPTLFTDMNSVSLIHTDMNSVSHTDMKSVSVSLDYAAHGAASGGGVSHKLSSRWDMYYHLPHNPSWELSSYKRIFSGIETVEQVILLNHTIPENIVKSCMLFVMREGIAPMWEDPKNRSGGCFSFKISNRNVFEVWKNVYYALVGGHLFKSRDLEHKINGITVSPKKNFCILKIWLSDCNTQSPDVIADIHGLMKGGCLFKHHLEGAQ